MHYVVYDVEMCKVPKGTKIMNRAFHRESIQIGAVLLDESYNTVDEFVAFISPKYGKIDNFITNLTNIHPEDVRNAPEFEEVIRKFMEWIPEDAKLVSWSDSDGMQLTKEARLKGVSSPRLDTITEEFIDCQKIFGERLDFDRKYKLSEALILTDIDIDAREHDGLADARNTAELFKKLSIEKELKLNNYYYSSTQETEHLQSSLGDLIRNMNIEIKKCA